MHSHMQPQFTSRTERLPAYGAQLFILLRLVPEPVGLLLYPLPLPALLLDHNLDELVAHAVIDGHIFFLNLHAVPARPRFRAFARFAVVQFMGGMRLDVALKRAVLREGTEAVLARVGLLAGVDSLVDSEVAFRQKTFPAFFTFERTII